MRVLVTGGTGVVGRSTVTALLQRGQTVQLLSRHADRDAKQWPHGVHPIVGNVADASSIVGAADGCEAVLHLTAIVDEHGPQTFARVNVEGTRNVLREARRAGARKVVFVSSLGAERGDSAYHRSKRQAEAIVREFGGAWTIVRPGSVYGPGDGQISLLLRMVRTLPVLPVIGDGDQQFQPIWHEDLAEALASVVERDDLAGKTLDVAGAESTSQGDLIRRLARITGRDVPRIGVPELLARLGIRVATVIGVDVPFNDSQLKMLLEGNQIAPGRENTLLSVLHVQPTPLDEGLRRVAAEQPEQLPEQGVGPLRRKRYWAHISGSGMTPERLMDRVREQFADLMSSFIDTRPEPTARTTIEEGATLTLNLPLRGHIQIRVAESEERVLTLITLAGHPLAGAVRFLSEARADNLRFEVQVYDRAANVIDYLMMRTLGERVEDASWRELIVNVVRASGGSAPEGVRADSESLEDAQAERIEQWLRDLVTERQREEAGI